LNENQLKRQTIRKPRLKMAKTKMTKPNKITVGIAELVNLKGSFKSPADFGKFLEKAIDDLAEGCTANDVDCRVREVFTKAVKSLEARQKIFEKNNRKKATAKSQKTCTGANASISPNSPLAAPVHIRPVKRPYGESGLVMLTDQQAANLKSIYGKDFDAAVNALTVHLSVGNRDYPSHYAVMLPGCWVYERITQMRISLKKLDAAGGPRNFAAEEREAKARMIRGESVNHDSKVADSDLTTEQIRELYG
jgi:hypothetical protein